MFTNPELYEHIEVHEDERVILFIKQYHWGVKSVMSLSYATHPEQFKELLAYLGYSSPRIDALTKSQPRTTEGN